MALRSDDPPSDTPQQTNDNDRDPGTEVVLVRSCLRNTDGVCRLGWRLTERGEGFPRTLYCLADDFAIMARASFDPLDRLDQRK
jgi:hypothetical protein